MKYTLTGGAGNITKPLALALLQAGHTVTVIGRDAAKLKELTQAGAIAAIGSVEDVAFLTAAFKGADAVYTMVPPTHAVTDWKAHIGQIGQNYATAIAAAGVKQVVNLSSVGAHLPDGVGPVSGLHRAENALNTLTDVNILHLRPAYFYQNLLANISLIKGMGIIGANFSAAPGKFPIVATDDIAAVAAEALLSLQFRGHSFRYIASDETGTDQIAQVLGAAIGKTDLAWVKFTDEQALGGMIQAGLPEETAKNYAEMNHAIDTGSMYADYFNNKPSLGNSKLADFAKVFAGVYAAG
jgi:uncharacterized protein YbjT (DUF2867 family)